MRKNQCVSEKLNNKQKMTFETQQEAEDYLGAALKYSVVYLCDNGGCGKYHTSSGGKRGRKADPNSNKQRKRRERKERREQQKRSLKGQQKGKKAL